MISNCNPLDLQNITKQSHKTLYGTPKPPGVLTLKTDFIMNNKKLAKFKMLRNLIIFFHENSAIIEKLPNFNEFLADLESAVALITENDEEKGKVPKVTEQKTILHDALITITVDHANKLHALARFLKDQGLMSDSKIYQTDLSAISALELVKRSNNLHGLINNNLSQSAPYLLTEESQTKLRTAIDAFNGSIPQSRQAQLKTKECSMLEDQGFELAENTLEEMDALAEIIRLSDPIFYSKYKNARKTIEITYSTLKAQGTITDLATGKPIPGAILTFRLQGSTDVVLEKETAAKGGFMIKSLDDAIYEVTIEKIGFKTQTITVTISWDEPCNLDVKMERV